MTCIALMGIKRSLGQFDIWLSSYRQLKKSQWTCLHQMVVARSICSNFFSKYYGVDHEDMASIFRFSGIGQAVRLIIVYPI